MHCSTGAPFAKKAFHSAKSFYKWLDILSVKDIPFTNISLTGGEPFLHPRVRDGSFIRLLKARYPSKSVGLTTNFSWASKESIIRYAPVISLLEFLCISIYEAVVQKLGGLNKFDDLVAMLQYMCPSTKITLYDHQLFGAWELHEDRREVKGQCCTSDCFVLKPDGTLAHCSIAIGAQNIPEYNSILKKSKEALLDLSKLGGKEEFLSWQQKYPFDLCFNCTMWEEKCVPWRPLRPQSNAEKTEDQLKARVAALELLLANQAS
jgi:hypothetical protein